MALPWPKISMVLPSPNIFMAFPWPKIVMAIQWPSNYSQLDRGDKKKILDNPSNYKTTKIMPRSASLMLCLRKKKIDS